MSLLFFLEYQKEKNYDFCEKKYQKHYNEDHANYVLVARVFPCRVCHASDHMKQGFRISLQLQFEIDKD